MRIIKKSDIIIYCWWNDDFRLNRFSSKRLVVRNNFHIVWPTNDKSLYLEMAISIFSNRRIGWWKEDRKGISSEWMLLRSRSSSHDSLLHSWGCASSLLIESDVTSILEAVSTPINSPKTVEIISNNFWFEDQHLLFCTILTMPFVQEIAQITVIETCILQSLITCDYSYTNVKERVDVPFLQLATDNA